MKEVHILGGGLGGLSTAWALLRSPEASKLGVKIIVHQLGWRLGGKGRTGRAPNNQYRVIEHGLHALGGYYHNTFRMIRSCIRCGDHEDEPLNEDFDCVDCDAEVRKRFEPTSRVGFPVRHGDGSEDASIAVRDWELLGKKEELPGDRWRAAPSVGTLLGRMVEYLGELELFELAGPERSLEFLAPPDPVRQAVADGQKRSRRPFIAKGGATAEAREPGWAPKAIETATQAIDHAAYLATANGEPSRPQTEAIGWFASRALEALETSNERAEPGPYQEMTDAQRRVLQRTVTRLCLACAVGVIANDCVRRGLDVLNCTEFRDFLRLSGASEETVNSGVVKGIYDYVFAYDGGQHGKFDLAAGVAVRFILLFFMDAVGGLQWHMTQGMGESLILPVYQALKKAEVEFRFYSDVQSFEVSEDRRRVTALHCRRQVPNPPDATIENDPYLATDGDRVYWPDRPLASTLGRTTPRRSKPIKKESAPPGFVHLDDHSYEVRESGLGRDETQVPIVPAFVVLAIPPAAHASIVPEPISRAWSVLLEDRHNVETQSVQVWTRTKPRLMPFFAVGGENRNFPSIADMSHHKAYDQSGCEAMFFLVGQAPRLGTTKLSVAQKSARKNFKEFIESDPHGLVTELGLSEWSYHAQRNILPSDLYCRSGAHTIHHRPRAVHATVENLMFAGDWVRTGLDFGCVESTVLSGMQAANGILDRLGKKTLETYQAGGPWGAR